jgi:hypothetical protein
MTAPSNGPRRYEVHGSASIAAAIRRVYRQASRQGRGEIALRALREIVRRLKLDPFDVGEPAYRLPSLQMQVRTVSIRPLVVHFAVCEDRPLVFIRRVKLLSDKGS